LKLEASAVGITVGSRWRSTKEKRPVTRHHDDDDDDSNNNVDDEVTGDKQCKYFLVSNS
jgi:hypothetical protein